MAIQVTCRHCHTRFTVSDQYAGKKGPCPKCKSEIEIPKAEEQVQVHAPEGFGPKDSSGKSVLKPLTRSDTKIGPIQIIGIIGTVVIAVVGAIAIGKSGIEKDSTQMWLMLGIGATIMAPILSYAGYTFLRDQERGSFLGTELWIRIAICGAGYALLWVVLPLVQFTVGEYDFVPVMIGGAIMLAAGAGIALATLELDYLMGLLHYGLYFGACLGLRWLAGVGVLPFVAEA